MKPLHELSPADIDIDVVKAAIRDVPDFPKPGILFKDVTTVMKDAELFAQVIDYFALQVRELNIDAVVGIESRGFILGAPLAYRLGASFVPVRKKGKLPAAVHQLEYTLEYGSDCIEIHQDAVHQGTRVLIVDDLIATGGTAAATAELIQKIGGDLQGMLFMVELLFLEGRNRLPANLPLCHSMITY